MNPRLPLLRYALWLAVFAAVGYGRKSMSQVVSGSPVAQSSSVSRVTTATQSPAVAPSTTPSPGAKADQSPSSDLAKLETRVRPSVIWVTVFDAKGNLLRTQSGFFISPDGRFVTTEGAIEGGINAVAKTADGGIYNVSGILAASKALDLAVLQADVKPRKLLRFLELHKDADLTVGTGVAVVGSALAGSEGSAREMTIASQGPERLEITGATPLSAVGSPVVNLEWRSSRHHYIRRGKNHCASFCRIGLVVVSRCGWHPVELAGNSRERYTTGNTETAIGLCARPSLSSRGLSARPFGNRPLSSKFRCPRKRNEYPAGSIHRKSAL